MRALVCHQLNGMFSILKSRLAALNAELLSIFGVVASDPMAAKEARLFVIESVTNFS